MAIKGFAQAKPGQDVFRPEIARWAKATFMLTFTTNILVTSLIAGRLWWISRGVRKHFGKGHSSRYHRAIILVVESGALYSSSLLVFIVLYTMEYYAEMIVYDSVSQIACIAPILIIVRAGLGIQPQEESLFIPDSLLSSEDMSSSDPDPVFASLLQP
ncbi:hypothetical protein BDV98DRAFT_514405 [Pterulicium gracile]|uniref:Uncharacterized protein n=1 Tax=Pterulicium gracile TaxID=1884261 RepID=A0A5C3QA61_9AGAR|nr:hypothetical protein BDV98DRAFT_514405 [Pterula gracilis]